jgi:glycosyltransferase involved in cell wall biosynthesis
MRENIRISVVMPVYSRQDTVERAIESILQQSFKDFEFIIIDDGSTDGTFAILDEYAKRDNRIVLLKQTRRGLTYSLNHALKIARGEYVLRQDADDVSAPGRIRRQLEYIEKNNLDIVCSFAHLINKKGVFLKIIKSPVNHYDIVRKLEQSNCILHPTLIFRKSAAISIGGFNEHFELAQDYDFYLRGILNGLKFGVVPEPLVRMMFNPSGSTVQKRRQQLLYAISAQSNYFAKKDTFRLIYLVYILQHIFKMMIPASVRNLRTWNRNRKSQNE